MSCSEKGFTMVELMVSILIITVGLLGLFQAVYSTIEFNMGNQLRGEAVTYGDEVMGQQINKGFANISSNKSYQASSNRPIGTGYWNFSSTCNTVHVTDNTTSVQVQVRWKYKGGHYTHTLSSLVSQ